MKQPLINYQNAQEREEDNRDLEAEEVEEIEHQKCQGVFRTKTNRLLVKRTNSLSLKAEKVRSICKKLKVKLRA